MVRRRGRGYVNRLLIASGVLLALIIALTAIKSNRYIAEHVFTRGISRAYIYAVGHINDLLFPFSFFEFATGAAIIIILITIIRWIVLLTRKEFGKAGKGAARLLTAVLAVILLYTATASFSYNRDSIDGHIPMSSEKPDEEAIMEMVNYYITDFNALAEKMPRNENGVTVSPYSYKELARIMVREMERLDDDYFSPYTPMPKRMIAGDAMGAFGVIGISFQPTGEANISSHTVPFGLPALMAHELAHSKGIMRESDAELVSAYITLTSEDEFVRYSGYIDNYGRIYQMLTLNNLVDKYKEKGYALRSPLIIKDYEYMYAEYGKYPDIIDEIGTFFNNIYLKLSGVKEGTGSYDVIGDIVIVKPPDGPEQRIVYYSTIQKMLIHKYKTSG